MNHGRLRKTGTAAGLVPLLLVAGLLTAAAAAGSCEGWNTVEFFASATVEEVTACLRAGRDPNRPDRQGLTALHRAARETGDPAVIEALLEAGANPRASSNAGRRPGHFARKNNKIKNSDAYQRLRMLRAPKADWSRVQAVSHNAKIAVRLYEDVASQRHRKITGRFDSATADSITLRFKDGQTRTIEKGAVRKVLIYRPFAKGIIYESNENTGKPLHTNALPLPSRHPDSPDLDGPNECLDCVLKRTRDPDLFVQLSYARLVALLG